MAVDLPRSLLLCWLLTWKPTAVSGSDCTEPFPVANAYRKWEGGADTTWANYTCLAGYDLTGGDLHRQCQGGAYSGNAPTCLLNCGPPLNYTHSKANSANSLSGVYVSYTCMGTTNQTAPINRLYCDPAIGRWESPVYCAEKETIVDSIQYLLPSTGNSISSDSTAGSDTASSDDATNHISVTTNNVIMTTSDAATIAYTAPSSVELTGSNDVAMASTAGALASTVVVSQHSTLLSVGTFHTDSPHTASTEVNDGSSSHVRSVYDTLSDVSSVYSSFIDFSSVYSLSNEVSPVYSLWSGTSSVYSSSSDPSPDVSSSSDSNSVYSSSSDPSSDLSSSSDSNSVYSSSSDPTSFSPPSTDFSSVYSLSSDPSSVYSASNDNNYNSDFFPSSVQTSSDLSSLNPDSSDVNSVYSTSGEVSDVYLSSSDSNSVHLTSRDSSSFPESTSTPSTEHLSLQPSMTDIAIPMTSLTTDINSTPSNLLTVDSSTGIHTNVNVSSASTLGVSISSETCQRQNRLVVSLDGGPYEILQVAIIRPSEEDLYNFRLEVHSPMQTCDTASRLPWENRTLVDCTAERLFPIGKSLIIRGSTPDVGTIKICDVQVYGRIPSVDCGVPRPFPGRRVVFTTASLYSTAIYYCDHGYHYRGGQQQVQCKVTGYWESYGLYCSDKEKIDPTVTTIAAASEWTDNDIGTCSPVNGTTLDLSFELGGKYEIKMVTITTPASAASLTIVISRDGLNKTCTVSSPPDYVHQTGEITVAIGCSTAPVGDHLDLAITGLTGGLCEVKVFGRLHTGEGVECRQSSKGQEFKGSVNMTVNGRPCLPWVTAASLQLEDFPDMTWEEAANNCRNPNGQNSPWCYIDLSKNWEECPVVHCDTICRRYADGSTYSGSVDTTEDGSPCIGWNKDSVPFKRTAMYPGGQAAQDSCRNPISSMTRPWCYTNTNTQTYGYCNIPGCPKASEYVTEYHLLDHHGVLLDLNKSNFTECFHWIKKQNSAQRLPKGSDLESHVIESCGKTYTSNMTMMCSVATDNGTRWVYSILECVNCGHPSKPPGMVVSYVSTYFPAVATYSCASGYVRDSGTGNFSCLGTGHWDNATLFCIVDCGPPDKVIGASLEYNQTFLDSTAYHHCLVTNETTNVTCTSSGNWGSPVWLADCLVDCGLPQNETNMNVSYTSTLSGSTAVYDCIDRYVATAGSGDAECRHATATWTKPTLICKIDCGSPATQTNMNVTYTSTVSGSTAVYACIDGYATASGSRNVICQDSGHWTSTTLNCVEMSDTPSVPLLTATSDAGTSSPSLSPSPSVYSSPSSSVLSPNTAVVPSPTSSSSLSLLTSSYSSSTSSSSSYSPLSPLPSSSASEVAASPSSSSPYLLSSSSSSPATYSSSISSQLSTSEASTPLYPLSSGSSSSSISPSSASRVITSTCLPLCFCGANNLDSLQLEEIKKSIRAQLLLDKNTLSKERRKLVSASDVRPSSQAIGHSAWILLVILFGVLFFNDMISLVRGVVRIVRRVKRGKFAARF
ncbi:serine-rich adhesin for platelets-like [Haliotis cracherodii]|uniref:serine-rich adhesin for platelets-like n=1 Tax=Haliotis cracherodii TaxID=6455 RepID=UPI0039E7BACD